MSLLNTQYYEDEEFTIENISTISEYSSSEFISCRFVGVDLSSLSFDNSTLVECVFEKSNLSNATFKNSTLRDLTFKNCKLTGVNFSSVNSLFELKFYDCLLNLSSFHSCKSPNIVFSCCDLREADFNEAQMNGAIFCDSILEGASLNNGSFEKSDFRGAKNYFIDPKFTRIRKSKFSLPEALTLLTSLEVEVE